MRSDNRASKSGVKSQASELLIRDEELDVF